MTPEELTTTLQEGVYRTITKATDGLLDHNISIWHQVDDLVDAIVNEIFQEETDEEAIEELYADMDQFPGN